MDDKHSNNTKEVENSQRIPLFDLKRKAGPPWVILLSVISFSLFVLLLFNWGRPSLQAVALIILIGQSALVIGALLGFIFDIPRTV